jgi:hypothetical protein
VPLIAASVDFAPASPLITLASEVLELGGGLPVAVATTLMLVAAGPHTQWLIWPATMFTQDGADEAVQAMAKASL